MIAKENTFKETKNVQMGDRHVPVTSLWLKPEVSNGGPSLIHEAPGNLSHDEVFADFITSEAEWEEYH